MRSITFILLILVTCSSLFSTAQSLDSILMLAVENNPELKSLKLEFEAVALKADQVSQLPDPQLGVGIPVLRPETRLGPQIVMVSANQMFPWFGTLKAKENVVLKMSKVKYEKIELERLMLFNKVKIAYFKLQFLNEKETILKEILVQLETMKNISLSKVEAGQISSSNVLRIQLKIDELSVQIKKIEQEKIKEFVVINAVTSQPWETEINPDKNNVFPIVEFDINTYQSKIREGFPMIRMLNLQQEASMERMEVNRKMNAPKLGVGVDYSLVNERVDMDPLYNGRDILIPKVMLSVPIYRKAYKAKEKEEILIQESIDFKKEQLELELLSLLLQYKADYDNAVIDHDLFISQTEIGASAYEMLLTDYMSSGKGFDDLLQVQIQLLQYKIDEKQSLLRAKIAVSNIERFTEY